MSIRRRLCVVVCLASSVLLTGCFLFQNHPPTAAFVARYNVLPGDPMVVDLDATGSTDPDEDAVTRFMWAFSDNLTLVQPTDFSAVRATPVLRVRCPNEGSYTITLVVEDERGLASEPLVKTIVVPLPTPGPDSL